MCFFEHFEQTDAETFLDEIINLDVLQRALEARIRLSTEAAEAAFKQALRSPSQSTLAAVDQQIDLLQSMRVDAKCIKNLGRTDSYARLDGILDDFTSMRSTLAKTMALLATVSSSNIQSHYKGRPAYASPTQLYH